MTPDPSHIADRDWPEDFAMENGNYLCRCRVCKETFAGHKRRIVCKLCDQQNAKTAPEPVQGEAVEVVCVAYITRADKQGPKIAVTLKKESAEAQHANWLSLSKTITTEPLMTVAQHHRIMAAAKPGAEPAYWQVHHLDSQRGWSEWETIKPTGAYVGQTVETMLGEYRAYIEWGKKYELRALYTAPPSPDADADAELVDLLSECRRYAEKAWPDGVHSYRNIPNSGNLVSRIDAKLASLRKGES